MTAEDSRGWLTSRDPVAVLVVLLVAAFAAWLVTIQRMQGMDAGPGTDLGAFGWYLGVWVTMMAAMMLPSVAPMVLAFSRLAADRARRGRRFVPTWVFASGYLLAWTAYGIVAYGVFRLIRTLDLGVLDWDRGGPWIAGGAVAAAGVYQLSPLKRVCLNHCRTPLHFLVHGWHEGWGGALRMGLVHGAYCVGCCWGLMVILFALGVMSVFWMALVAAVIFLEKVTPLGARLPRASAVLFVAFGLAIAIAPGAVPGLTEPDDEPGMTQMDRMAP